MNDLRRKFLLQILDRIEEQESKLLVWGVVDGVFSEDELDDLIFPLIDSAEAADFDDFEDTEVVIKNLCDLGWLFSVDLDQGQIGFRSRMAETVRLLQRLRQLFPKHARQTNGWQSAPTLVADFRFQRRRRQYPVRNMTVDEVLKELGQASCEDLVLSAVRKIIGDDKLAGFQVRATSRILKGLEDKKRKSATIVCAGTGSGKTLAFYLPALSSIARHHFSGKSKGWVKTVSLYPRSELLKDQLREVLRRVNDLNQQFNSLNICVGAFYGDVPENVVQLKSLSTRGGAWRRVGGDYICPSLKCISSGCDGDMLWVEQDLARNKERLTCGSCGCVVDGQLFPLTRESLAKSLPDILLTTTEMLNQRLSDNKYNHLFGIGMNAQGPPELVLLDEVHTYEGRHGAQVAYLLRRWTRKVAQRLNFVGLSATLREANTFFSDLTGTYLDRVEEVSPNSSELVTEGAEYMIALRGDPVSRAALLSTTIQSAMLLARCLDPPTASLKDSVSKGAFGQRTFLFTDDLDINNRAYFDLLDAEGRNSNGSPNTSKSSLASLRLRKESVSRYKGGQDWRMVEEIGHSLDGNGLTVGRVSSQDRGVSKAQVIVATAALEVGFDDPSVGAVVQHKTPRGTASFLQRKGRAGRLRGMRPWTAIILSDYGRDRLSYQNYDLLFDPELGARSLPLSNRYIIRMQAVFATIDYIGQKLQYGPDGNVWKELSEPTSGKRKALLVKELRLILESDRGAEALSKYLRYALDLTPAEVASLMWEYPRPLMTMVLPTALRRVESDWRAYGESKGDLLVRNNPLPDFVPATLFADLNLAEVDVVLPDGQTDNRTIAQEGMPVFSALREFAPGRVSRRFGFRYRTERHWVAPPVNLSAEFQSSGLDIDTLGSFQTLGTYSYFQNGSQIDVPVLRPLSIITAVPGRNISDTSQARLNWFSQIVPVCEPDWLIPPVDSVWSTLITRLGFFTHTRHTPVEIRRFATGSKAEVGTGSDQKVSLDISFCDETGPVALGATYMADGLVFQIKMPASLHGLNERSEAKWRALRTARFIDSSWRGEFLSSVASPFARKWLAEVFLSAVTFEAITSQGCLESAAIAIKAGSASISLRSVLDTLFQSQANFSEEQAEFESPDRLRHELNELLVRNEIVEELMSLGRFLWEPISSEWEPWLRKTYQCTLGAALLRAVCDLCPTIDPDDLEVDLGRGPLVIVPPGEEKSAEVEIWITEKSPGGSGLIEEFTRRYGEDPRRYFSLVRASLEMGEFELIDHQMSKLLARLGADDSEIREAVMGARNAKGHNQLVDAMKVLRLSLLHDGFSPFHGFLVSLGSRILKPGSGRSTDSYLAKAIKNWRDEEVRLGLEIDLRVICYWFSQSDEIDQVASDSGIPLEEDRTAWRLSTIYGLLWSRGREIRESSLQIRSQFEELPQTERLLVIDTISDDRAKVMVDSEDWLVTASQHLRKGRLVTLSCREGHRGLLGKALHALITNPIETDYLNAFARLQAVRQTNDILEADIELLEAVQ